MDNGYVYLAVETEDSIDNYLYDNLVSVNRPEEEEKPDYLELLTMDVKELKDFLLKMSEQKNEEETVEGEEGIAADSTQGSEKEQINED